VEKLLSTLWDGNPATIKSACEIDAVGHRVVHGGSHYEEPTLITKEVEL